MPLVVSASTRRVEKGFLADYAPHAFVSVSEGFPYWILGLEPGMVTRLHFPGSHNATALRSLSEINGVASPLVTKAVTYIGLNKVRFDSAGALTDIHLDSGSLDFLTGFGNSARAEIWALLLVDQPWRTRRLPKRKHSRIRWIRKQHSEFGGSTDFGYLFGVIGLDQFKRNVASICFHRLMPVT